MPNDNQVPIEQIAKIADDVRTIENFAANNNFDSSLIASRIIPGSNSRSAGWLVLAIVISVTILVAIICAFLFWPELPEAVNRFLFLIGILDVGLISACVHGKFRESTITWIVAIATSVVLLVAAGIFTPREAIEIIKPK